MRVTIDGKRMMGAVIARLGAGRFERRKPRNPAANASRCRAEPCAVANIVPSLAAAMPAAAQAFSPAAERAGDHPIGKGAPAAIDPIGVETSRPLTMVAGTTPKRKQYWSLPTAAALARPSSRLTAFWSEESP